MLQLQVNNIHNNGKFFDSEKLKQVAKEDAATTRRRNEAKNVRDKMRQCKNELDSLNF